MPNLAQTVNQFIASTLSAGGPGSGRHPYGRGDEFSEARKKASEWREHLWNRSTMTRLAKQTTKGGRMEQFHPGSIRVYRGKDSSAKNRTGSSWSKSKAVAQRYGSHVEYRDIDEHTPALDVNKLLKGIPSKSARDKEVFIASSIEAGGPGSGWFTENGHVGHDQHRAWTRPRRPMMQSPQVMKPKHQEGLAQRGFKFVGNMARNGSQPTGAKTGQDIYVHPNGWKVVVKHEGAGKFRYRLLSPSNKVDYNEKGFANLMQRYDAIAKANKTAMQNGSLTVQDKALNPKQPALDVKPQQQLARPQAPKEADSQAPGPKWLDSLKRTYLQTVGARYEAARSSDEFKFKVAAYDMGFGVNVVIARSQDGEDQVVVSRGMQKEYRGNDFTAAFKKAQSVREAMQGQDDTPVGPVNPAPSVDEKLLATTPIVASEKLGGSMSSPMLKTLSDGTQMVFKKDSQEPNGLRVNVSHGQQAIREVAAYKISQIVGDKMVPTTVFRTDEDGAKGVAQLFAKGNTVALETMPGKQYGNRDTQQRAAAFDYVIGNTDRHEGNWLVDDKGNVTLIDHGLAFPSGGRGVLYSEFINHLASSLDSVSSQVANNYVSHKAEILKTLRDLKLPEQDIIATGNRIDDLKNRTGRWYASNNMHAAKVKK